MINVLLWAQVDPPIADDPTWRSIFQAQAEKEAKRLGIKVGEAQRDQDDQGRPLLVWEEVK